MTKRVVVTADDFGLSRAVNDAVEIAHRDGVLAAASLMVAAPSAAEAVDVARRNPTLGVGLHVVLVEGAPFSPPELIPDLVGADGQFRTDMAQLGVDMFFRPSVRRQLQREIESQFAAFAKTGLPLDHVNAHKHFHLHPTIAGALFSAAARAGVRHVRVPAENARLVASIDGARAGATGMIMAPWTALLRARARSAGLVFADTVFGLAWSGAVTTERLQALAQNLPDGLTEIYMHPATSSDFPGAVPGYRYVDELSALTDPKVVALISGLGPKPMGFRGATMR